MRSPRWPRISSTNRLRWSSEPRMEKVPEEERRKPLCRDRERPVPDVQDGPRHWVEDTTSPAELSGFGRRRDTIVSEGVPACERSGSTPQVLELRLRERGFHRAGGFRSPRAIRESGKRRFSTAERSGGNTGTEGTRPTVRSRRRQRLGRRAGAAAGSSRPKLT